MTRTFRVTIGGISYLVEVEEVAAQGNPAPAVAPAKAVPAPPAPTPPAPAVKMPPAVPAAPPAPAAAAARTAPPAPAAKGREPSVVGETVRAPLPGTVVAVRYQPGQEVAPGDVLLVLEAMKMENDIVAPVGGTVKEVLVEKGVAVALGDALAVIG